jgi:micrococcal nuclease
LDQEPSAGMSNLNKEYLKILFIFLVFFCFCGFSTDGISSYEQVDPSSFPDKGRVILVYDGDTVRVKFDDGQEWRVRLIGINTPEIGDARPDVAFKAQLSKRFTFFHLYRKKIKLTYESKLFDSYGRILAYIWTDEQELFNKFIITEGFASAYVNFRFSYREEFKQDEKEAKRLEKGYWKKGENKLIQVEEVNGFIGQLVSVEFICTSVRLKRKLYYLSSSEGEFSALIPKENLSLFPMPQFYKGKVLAIKGFLEEYKGNPQIMVFTPAQIKKEED